MTHSPSEILRTELENWRKDAGWSQETLTATVVEAHFALAAEVSTEITFQRGRDAYQDMRTNKTRLYRWLSVDSADPALPADMVPSILAALPVERRLRAAMAMLGDACQLSIMPRHAKCEGLNVLDLVAETNKEASEGTQALVSLARNPTPEAARKALSEVTHAEAAFHHARVEIEASIAEEDHDPA
ncbi:toxin YdaT family protein [Chitinimonas arctica]|nr:toxin YdaT family protein [Chitinimonas arctica]